MQYSILISTYECHGKGVEFLNENLLSVFLQTYRPLQCIVSDHSKDDVIENMVKNLDTRGVEFIYVRYNENYGSPCHNWNNALKYSTGDYIHYIAMDDKFYDEKAVESIVSFMKTNNSKWVASSHLCDNQKFTPRWNNNILQCNTISGPSGITIVKELKNIKLDPAFIWFLDLDWYYRLYLEAGSPMIFDQITWCNRIHPFQLTNIVCNEHRNNAELNTLYEKYGKPLPQSFVLN